MYLDVVVVEWLLIVVVVREWICVILIRERNCHIFFSFCIPLYASLHMVEHDFNTNLVQTIRFKLFIIQVGSRISYTLLIP